MPVFGWKVFQRGDEWLRSNDISIDDLSHVQAIHRTSVMKLFFCGFAVFLALPLFGQNALTNEDVLRMVQTGIPQSVIIAAIAETPSVQFNLLYVSALTNGGVSDDVVRAMAARAYGRPVPGYKPSPKNATNHALDTFSSNEKVTAPSALQAADAPTHRVVNAGHTQVAVPLAGMQLSVPSAIILHDSTPVRLRLSRNISSADATVGGTVDFEVLEDVMIGNTLIVARGDSAIATITRAQKKRRLGRGGKLDINIDYVRAVDGEKLALRGVKQASGGGHTGAMTGAIVATSLVFWPAAPFFLLVHGKDITIPKGTELTAYSDGEITLDFAAFTPPASAPVPVTQLKGPKLTNADILTMKTGGLSDMAIITTIKASGADYELGVNNLVELQKMVSSEVIVAMVEASK